MPVDFALAYIQERDFDCAAERMEEHWTVRAEPDLHFAQARDTLLKALRGNHLEAYGAMRGAERQKIEDLKWLDLTIIQIGHKDQVCKIGTWDVMFHNVVVRRSSLEKLWPAISRSASHSHLAHSADEGRVETTPMQPDKIPEKPGAGKWAKEGRCQALLQKMTQKFPNEPIGKQLVREVVQEHLNYLFAKGTFDRMWQIAIEGYPAWKKGGARKRRPFTISMLDD